MTQEEKELLIKDLCARLPYGVMIQIPELFYSQRKVVEKLVSINDLWHFNDDGAYIENVKPYLRPMSSMTKEEKETMDNLWKDNNKLVFADPDEIRQYRFYDISVVDFLNSHHFDYRGLIEKGLALEATEGMYDIKTE